MDWSAWWKRGGTALRVAGVRELTIAVGLLQLEVWAAVQSAGMHLAGVDTAVLLAQNGWPKPVRDRMLLVLVGLEVAVALAALALAWCGRGRAVARAAHLLLPVVPLSLLANLWVPEVWRSRPLGFLVSLGAVSLLLERSIVHAALQLPARSKRWLRARIDALGGRSWLPLVSVISFAALYIGASGLLTVWKHHGFTTGAYDLAIFDNLMWNAMHGHPFQSSIMYNDGPGNSLAGHAEIAMLFFVPFYAIHPSSEALLWIQAVCVGGAAIPLFLLARQFVGQWTAALLAVLYLFFAPVHGSQFYDYHWLTIITPFLLLNFYALQTRRHVLAGLTTVLLWLLREDVAPGLAVLGFVMVAANHRPRAGALLAATSGLWFVTVKFLIMPSFGTWFFASLYSDLNTPTESGYGSVIKTLVTNPVFALQTLLREAKLQYALHLLVPLAFIPIRRVWLAALLLPAAFFTVLTNWPAASSIGYQYSAHATAYLFAGTAAYLGSVSGLARRAGATAALTLALLCHSASFGAWLSPESFVSGSIPALIRQHDRMAGRLAGLRRLAALIPADASVIATTHESPHLSARRRIYSFGHSRVAAEYVVIHPDSFPAGSTKADILAVFRSQSYGLVARDGQTTLWRQGHTSPETDAALRKLFRAIGGGHPPRGSASSEDRRPRR